MRFVFGSIALFGLLVLGACDKCGSDVDLGDFVLLEESKADWYPYIGVDELIFENSVGDTLRFAEGIRRDEMVDQTYRDICKGNKVGDIAKEVYRSERYVVEYSVVSEDITYFLSISLYVDRFVKDGAEVLEVYDRVGYTSTVKDYRSTNNPSIEGSILLVANGRGTAVEHEDLWYNETASFAEEMQINGQSYRDVWYYESAGKPNLYVQEGRGVIAFLGFDGVVWVLAD